MYERVTSLTEMQSDSSPLGYVEERSKHPVTPSPRHPSFHLWMLRHRGVARALRDHKSTCAQVTGVVDATSSPRHHRPSSRHTKEVRISSTCFAPRESKFTKSPWTSRTCDGLGTDPPSTHHTPSTSPRLRTKCLKYLKYRVR